VSRRNRILGFGSAVLLVLAGIACAVVFSGGLGQNLAFALVALGLIEGTALVFYEVGLTEDRDRARERADRASKSSAPHDDEPRVAGRTPGAREADHPNRLSRPRSARDRMRGRPRRLR